MRGAGKHLRGRSLFDDPPEIHHHDPVAEMTHHMQIVADKDQRQMQLAAQIRQQIDDLRLHLDIKG